MDLPGHPKPLVGRRLPVLATAPPAHGHQGPFLVMRAPLFPCSPSSSTAVFPGSVSGAGKRVTKAALLFKALIVCILDTSSYILLSLDESASWPGQPEEGS